jgi:hypothetical protein
MPKMSPNRLFCPKALNVAIILANFFVVAKQPDNVLYLCNFKNCLKKIVKEAKIRPN